MRSADTNDENGASPDLNPQTFEDLVVLYDRKLYNLVLRLVKNTDDAADLTQEAFVKAFKAWDGFEGRASAYTWLCRIAINLCRNSARDKALWNTEPFEDGDLASKEPTPEVALQKSDILDKIHQSIDSLPGEYRVVIVLRDVQGLTYQEIADVSDMSVDMVRTKLARARGILRRKLRHIL